MPNDQFTHHGVTESVSRSWLVRDTRRATMGFDWCRVTWVPGSLLMSGDLGELSVSVPRAYSCYAVAELVLHTDAVYLLQKSDARKEWDRARTARDLRSIAADDHDESARLLRLAELVETNSIEQWELVPELAGVVDDYACAMKWPEHRRIQIAVLRHWATALGNQLRALCEAAAVS